MDEDEPGELVDGVRGRRGTEHPSRGSRRLVVDAARPVGGKAGRSGVRIEVKIAVGPRRGRKPDLSVFLRPHVPADDDALVRVSPYAVIEVLSPRPRDVRRDRIDKLVDYARAGAAFFWLVRSRAAHARARHEAPSLHGPARGPQWSRPCAGHAGSHPRPGLELGADSRCREGQVQATRPPELSHSRSSRDLPARVETNRVLVSRRRARRAAQRQRRDPEADSRRATAGESTVVELGGGFEEHERATRAGERGPTEHEWPARAHRAGASAHRAASPAAGQLSLDCNLSDMSPRVPNPRRDPESPLTGLPFVRGSPTAVGILRCLNTRDNRARASVLLLHIRGPG